MSTMTMQEYVDHGFWLCPCPRLHSPSLARARCCDAPKDAPAPAAKARRPKSANAVKAPSMDAIGGLRALPGHVLEFVVMGKAIPEGSMRSPKAGVVIANNPALEPWRRKVNRAAVIACGVHWEVVNAPVRVDLIFTLEAPQNPSTPFPATKPDADKLARAIGDALCPQPGKGTKIIAEDSRIIGYGVLEKTYPSPNHTHRDALTAPGVLIRLYPVALEQ